MEHGHDPTTGTGAADSGMRLALLRHFVRLSGAGGPLLTGEGSIGYRSSIQCRIGPLAKLIRRERETEMIPEVGRCGLIEESPRHGSVRRYCDREVE